MEYLDVEIQSVLQSVKKKLSGLDASYTAFDHDIIVSINSAFMTLHQLGIDDKEGKPIRITTPDQAWDEFIDLSKYEWIPDYVFIFVKLAFDPPSSSFVLESYRKQLDELTWRIEVERDLEINPYGLPVFQPKSEE